MKTLHSIFSWHDYTGLKRLCRRLHAAWYCLMMDEIILKPLGMEQDEHKDCVRAWDIDMFLWFRENQWNVNWEVRNKPKAITVIEDLDEKVERLAYENATLRAEIQKLKAN
jgi:hypothetical protein